MRFRNDDADRTALASPQFNHDFETPAYVAAAAGKASALQFLAKVRERERAAARNDALDAMAALVSDALGKNVWARAIHNAPDDWEEEEMVTAVRDILVTPGTAGYLWLLAKPTQYERMLLTAFSTKPQAINANL